MYASQWFLTLFTAKFPLYMVFHIIDLLLCEVGDERHTLAVFKHLVLISTNSFNLFLSVMYTQYPIMTFWLSRQRAGYKLLMTLPF